MNNKETTYLRPPEGVPTLHAGDLEYWLLEHAPNPGRQRSVQTSDPQISMHSYGGGRDVGLLHMFCFKGFRIGFLLDRADDVVLPFPNGSGFRDEKTKTVVRTITHIGTPVMDNALLQKRDAFGVIVNGPQGRPLVDTDLARRNGHFITGVTWTDYNDGRSTKFSSREQQDEMIALWPELLAGLCGKLANLAQKKRVEYPVEIRFSERMKNTLRSGDLIDGDT